jgi:diguanylate cyclase (GGDEF)-like protein/PAS domain S-box-containing protein
VPAMTDEKTIAQENHMFRSAFQQAAAGLAIISHEGIILHANSSFCQVVDYEESELIGSPLSMLEAPPERRMGRSFIQDLMNGRQTNLQFETRYLQKNGCTVWVRVQIDLVVPKPPAAAYFLLQLQDISEHIEAVRAVDRSYQHTVHILEAISDGLYSLDQEGRFTYVNGAAERFFGLAREQLLGHCLWTMYPEAMRSRVYAHFLRIDGSPPSLTYETYYSGTGKWYEMRLYRNGDTYNVYFLDISGRKHAEEELQKSEEMYRMLAEHSTDMISRHSVDGIYLYVSPACRHLLGYEPEELEGHSPYELFHPEDVERIRTGQDRLRIEPNIAMSAYRIRRKDGTYIWFETSARSIRGLHGQEEILAVSRDISTRKQVEQQLIQSNEQLLRISSVDPLTGVANRRFFDESFAKEWKQGLRYGTPLSVILLDIDYFKPYNDTYGHSEGDQCLQAVAESLKKVIKRPGDFVARYGGEEFVLVLPMTDSSGAMTVAEQLRHEVDSLHIPHVTSQVAPHVTISLGVATLVPNKDMTPRKLLIRADKALYQAKKEGRNRACLYHS